MGYKAQPLPFRSDPSSRKGRTPPNWLSPVARAAGFYSAALDRARVHIPNENCRASVCIAKSYGADCRLIVNKCQSAILVPNKGFTVIWDDIPELIWYAVEEIGALEDHIRSVTHAQHALLWPQKDKEAVFFV
ncbi:hypothetical protein NQ315_011737 [Exocentrus adspersus]|uniref:Uncharacterized protein n=1 Tax=Exocentrus adspersus TaxID=1586481 RepID=A0AAV8W1F3_9CUCU|nr:hypothetical protein NQ315_011737 [Exocentrus adspersus]